MQLCFEGTLFLRSYGNQSSNQLSKQSEKLVLDNFEYVLVFFIFDTSNIYPIFEP